MKKNLSLLILLVFTATVINAQSLIQKFTETTFTLSDDLKSPDGYCYGSVSYSLTKGFILMINAVGNADNVRPMFIVRGPIENGIETAPTLKFFDTTFSKETNAVYVINATGNYSIIIANGRKGEKGIVNSKMGLGRMDWLDNTKIFPTTSSSPFSLALAGLLRHAVFNFNLIKGQKDMFGNYKTTFLIPGANMDDAGTQIGIYTDLNATMNVDYFNACVYSMGTINYQSVAGKDEDNYSLWDQKDTTLAINKYENLKTMLTHALTTDFVVEREANFPLFTKGKDRHTIRKNGRRIIFTHKGNEAIIDPVNKFYSLLASNKMKVEMCLHSTNSKAEIYLRVYSDEK